ncbi:MAG: hypothetical protein H6721_16705 [Sandaracinus sp.]|nr:hypothetical protein [Sandaracinus sp.]MCB9618902.1 hypothetical protein [Sandaracinus sp.]MCB9633759.1 hypothetical protein [Sandaracinus sp.]
MRTLTLSLLLAIGCGGTALNKGEGEACVRSVECGPGLACVMAVCSSDPTGLGGTVPSQDAGAPPDAGDLDAGEPMDSGPPPDAGPPPPDAGPPSDAGPPPDGGIDAGIDGGIDAGIDGGVDAGMDAGTDAGVDAGPDEDAGM